MDAAPAIRWAGAAFAVGAVIEREARTLAAILFVFFGLAVFIYPVRAAAVAMNDRLYTFCSCFTAYLALAAVAHVLG